MTEADRLKGIIRGLLAAYDAKQSADFDLLAMEDGLSGKYGETWTQEETNELQRFFNEAETATDVFNRARALAEEAIKP